MISKIKDYLSDFPELFVSHFSLMNAMMNLSKFFSAPFNIEICMAFVIKDNYWKITIIDI